MESPLSRPDHPSSSVQASPSQPLTDHKAVSLSCHKVFFCVEPFSQPRSNVPPLRHETSWNLPSHSEHHRSTKRQKLSSMWAFLQSLIRRFSITRHTTFVQDVRRMFNNPRKHHKVNRDGTPTQLERSKRSTLDISSTFSETIRL